MDQKKQIADRLKQANNVLVTVSNNPSVDQLAACIGLTLALNKMGKHATAVFSGMIPSTIEFLQPEKTLEQNTDSLRDFIIALDKTKADKLRYKVEDKVVKIFITPYRTSISDKDLEFSQGDFNVDVVIALGVHQQAELDQAITSHGRILHDATIVSVNLKPGAELGTINWLVTTASSLSELAVELIDEVDKSAVDAQIATAFLTGIVAETHRFSNEKTTSVTMSISAELMTAGANQQLVSTKLEEPAPAPPPPPSPSPPEVAPEQPVANPVEAVDAQGASGTLEISHGDKNGDDKPVSSLEDLSGGDQPPEKKSPETPKIQIDEQGSLRRLEEIEAEKKEGATIDPIQHLGGSRMMLQPPSMSGAMSAAGSSEDNYSDPLSLPSPAAPGQPAAEPSPASGAFAAPSASAVITSPAMPYMPPSMTPGAQTAPLPPLMGGSFDAGLAPPGQPAPVAPEPAAPAAPALPNDPFAHVGTARDAVSQALGQSPPANPGPVQVPNAQPLGDSLHPLPAPPPQAPAALPDLSLPVPAGAPQPPNLNIPAPVGPPPPVPPPMVPTS